LCLERGLPGRREVETREPRRQSIEYGVRTIFFRTIPNHHATAQFYKYYSWLMSVVNEISWERGSTWPNRYIGVGTVNNHPGQYGNA